MNQWRLDAVGSADQARLYLDSNYSSEESEKISRRIHSPQAKRAMTICGDCVKHVGEDYRLPDPAGDTRMCDFVVDPVWYTPSVSGPAIPHERFEGAHPPDSASDELFSRVLGFNVEEFHDEYERRGGGSVKDLLQPWLGEKVDVKLGKI